MFGWTVEDLCGKSRRRPLVTARQIGMYVFRELTDYSYPKIAEEFGGRDHTTVMHACEKIGPRWPSAVCVRAGQRAHQPDQARCQWITLWRAGEMSRRRCGRCGHRSRSVSEACGKLWTAVPRSARCHQHRPRLLHNPQALLLQQP